MREFETGATRNDDSNKLDYEGFLSPECIKSFAEYMHKHRIQADGKLRDADNWQKGIPKDAYMKSMLRHVFDLWALHRGAERFEPETGKKLTKEELLDAIWFNVQGYLLEELRDDVPPENTIYIAGPMRGIKWWNFPAFFKAEEKLIMGGWNVVNPAGLDIDAGIDPYRFPEDFDWSKEPDGEFKSIVKRDIEALMDKCSAIYLLRGWEKSKGARAEKALAEWFELEIIEE